MEMLTPLISAAGLSWASGLRLYATLALVGIAHYFGWVQLPSAMTVLGNPWVMGGTGLLALIEFAIDKVPGLDSLWDSVHSFLKIPAGIALAAGSAAGLGDHWMLLAGLLGGGLVATSTATKSSTRMLLNVSPEPFTNIGASVAEDSIWVLSMVWLFANPISFAFILLIFVVLSVCLLLWVRKTLRTIGHSMQTWFK